MRLMMVGATLVGLMAFFLNNDYGQHIVADFFSLFRAQQIQDQATEVRQASRKAEDLVEAARIQQEEFQQMLQERRWLYEARMQQMQDAKEKLRDMRASGDTSDIDKLKDIIAKFKETDSRWRAMGIKINEKAETVRELNERTKIMLERQKEKQREVIDKAKERLERNRSQTEEIQERAQALKERSQDRLRAQQDAMRDKMDALRDRMER